MTLRGSITEEQTEFVETWENVSPVTNWIIKLDARGDEKHDKVPSQGRQFTVTTYERLLTQEKVADPKNDPFRNGCFRPIVVPDDVTVETNPNALSDDDIRRIFKASDLAWNEYMEVIDSPATVHRMMELAEDSDISLKRYRELQERHDEVNPRRRVVQKDRDEYEKMGEPGYNPSKRRVDAARA